MTIEYRSIPDSVRVVDESKHQLEITSCVYGVVDDYKTRWIPGVFTRSLEAKKPPLCWSHKWDDPIGNLADYTDGKETLRTLYQLDDFEAVPRARQAWAQYHSGTLTDASFGFSRSKDEPAEGLEGVMDIREARLDECSLVLSGAVPGVKIVGSRGIPASLVLDLGQQVERGQIDLETALSTLSRHAMTDDVRALHSHAKQDGSGSVSHSHVGDPHMHAHGGLMPVKPKGRAAPAALVDTVKCPSCGAMNEADAKFCDQCGAKMAGKMEAPHTPSLDETEARAMLAELRNA